MIRSYEGGIRRALAITTAASAGMFSLVGCSMEIKDTHVNPEVAAAMQNKLRPEAVKIGRLIIAGYQAHNGQYFYDSDPRVAGGQEITVDYRDDFHYYTLTADMMEGKNGYLDPNTTYEARIDSAQCHAWTCGDSRWTVEFKNTDTFYSGRSGHTEHRKIWYGEEDTYAPWDTNKLVAENDAHLYNPNISVNSEDFKKEMAEVNHLVNQANIALNVAQLMPAYGYGKVGSPKSL